LDKKKGMLFSIFHSDKSGFSVFDLNTDKELCSITMDQMQLANSLWQLAEVYLEKIVFSDQD
jgi:hypothetical protein